MNAKNSADFSSFKTRLSPAALACFRVLFGNVSEMLAQHGPQQKYETPVDAVLSLGEIDNVESVAESIREIIQCKIEVKNNEYLYFFPFFASVSIEGGKIRYSLHKEIEDAISLLPALFFV
ncbi:MAG: hypothetical protein PHO83_16235 [Geobacteraceae bacterium]|nr:hypothetical protein [Geobacteraceae bacterium]